MRDCSLRFTNSPYRSAWEGGFTAYANSHTLAERKATSMEPDDP